MIDLSWACRDRSHQPRHFQRMAAPDGLGMLTGKGRPRSFAVGAVSLERKIPSSSRTVTDVTSAMAYIPYFQDRPEEGKARPDCGGRDDEARHRLKCHQTATARGISRGAFSRRCARTIQIAISSREAALGMTTYPTADRRETETRRRLCRCARSAPVAPLSTDRADRAWSRRPHRRELASPSIWRLRPISPDAADFLAVDRLGTSTQGQDLTAQLEALKAATSFAFDRTHNCKGLAEADAIAAKSSLTDPVALCYRRQRLARITALEAAEGREY